MGKGASGEKYAEQSTQTYGFTFGGPLVKDKLFFFVGGEYYKDKTPATVYDENNIDGFVTMDQLNQIREQYKKLTGYDTAGFGQHTPEIWSANASRTARSAASFTRFARSAPTAPAVACAILCRSTSSASLMFFVCTRSV